MENINNGCGEKESKATEGKFQEAALLCRQAEKEANKGNESKEEKRSLSAGHSCDVFRQSHGGGCGAKNSSSLTSEPVHTVHM